MIFNKVENTKINGQIKSLNDEASVRVSQNLKAPSHHKRINILYLLS